MGNFLNYINIIYFHTYLLHLKQFILLKTLNPYDILEYKLLLSAGINSSNQKWAPSHTWFSLARCTAGSNTVIWIWNCRSIATWFSGLSLAAGTWICQAPRLVIGWWRWNVARTLGLFNTNFLNYHTFHIYLVHFTTVLYWKLYYYYQRSPKLLQ